MGEHRERDLARQVGSLEAERDSYRSRVEILEAEKLALQRAVRAATTEADQLREELRQERSARGQFVPRAVIGAKASGAVVEMEAAPL